MSDVQYTYHYGAGISAIAKDKAQISREDAHTLALIRVSECLDAIHERLEQLVTVQTQRG